MLGKFNYKEPAALRGVVVALVTLAASLGVVQTQDIDGVAEVLLPTVLFVVPLLQAVWTRTAVWSQQSVDEISTGRHAAR